jgi:hypothetical protein
MRSNVSSSHKSKKETNSDFIRFQTLKRFVLEWLQNTTRYAPHLSDTHFSFPHPHLFTRLIASSDTSGPTMSFCKALSLANQCPVVVSIKLGSNQKEENWRVREDKHNPIEIETDDHGLKKINFVDCLIQCLRINETPRVIEQQQEVLLLRSLFLTFLAQYQDDFCDCVKLRNQILNPALVSDDLHSLLFGYRVLFICANVCDREENSNFFEEVAQCTQLSNILTLSELLKFAFGTFYHLDHQVRNE